MKIPYVQSPNFKKGRRGQKINYLVIHTMQGSYEGTRAWFLNQRSQVSAHYILSKRGDITQMVKEEDSAWHCSMANPITIGIELEDMSKVKDANGKIHTKTSQNDPHWLTVVELDVAASLAADICHRHGLSVKNIIGHNDPILKRYGNNHEDPGPFFDMPKFREIVTKKLATLAGVKFQESISGIVTVLAVTASA